MVALAAFTFFYDNGVTDSATAVTIGYIQRDCEDNCEKLEKLSDKLDDIQHQLWELDVKVDTLLTNQPGILNARGIESDSVLYGNLTISIDYPRNNTKLKNSVFYINGTSSLNNSWPRVGSDCIYIVAKSLGKYWIYTKATPYYTPDGEWETPRPCIFTSALELESPLEIFAIISETSYYPGYSTSGPLNYAAKSDPVFVYDWHGDHNGTKVP